MLAVPGLVGRLLFGKQGSRPVAKALIRLVGIRDLVLGVGAITTVKEHTMDAEWVGMGAVADAVDGLVAIGARDLPARAVGRPRGRWCGGRRHARRARARR